MDEQLQRVLPQLAPAENEGPSKVLSLAETVRRYLRPGMTLHIAADAQAAAQEVLRAFHGTQPGFTLAGAIIEQHLLDLVHAGLVTKVIASNVCNMNPTPGPTPIVARALKEGRLEVENWSLYTMFLRFQAGAMGLPFLPTRSLLGSSMVQENREGFLELEDPFGSSQHVGLVKALRPDISLVHGLMADAAGNLVPVPIDGEAVWAARAAKQGVIATVERLADTATVRRYAPLVRIPAYKVLAVCVTPFGAHPQSLYAEQVGGGESYAEDRDFALEHRQAARSSEALDAWVKEWVLAPGGHGGYLKKLTFRRINRLKQRAAGLAAWDEELAASWKDLGLATNTESMVVAAARRIQEAVCKNSYRMILSGVGAGGLACYLALYQLRQQGQPVEVMIGTGPYGFLPRSAALDSITHLMTAKLSGDVQDVYGAFLRGPDSLAIGVLGAGQVDRHGNINSTRLGDGTFITGAGGSSDLVAGAAEALALAPMTPQRCVGKVDYITVPGQQVRTLVTDKGVLEKQDGELVLTTFLVQEGVTPEQAVAEAKRACGWDLRVAPQVRREGPPSAEELALLRALDVRRDFLS
ncbi:MAG: glutaconate CoA-transferase [Chloroflexi bacterium]|nr:glutaconate CoA-transferase [Chloroflexota bacterium]